MKKRNNKIIVLIVVAVLFAVSLLIFILNYSKDNSSFSILEKKWINDNTSNVLDISVYNDVPVYGKSGKGVIFDLLDDFTTTYGINFNKISYSVDSSSNLNKNAFRVLNNNESLTNKDILLYEDNYVLVSTEEEVINNINNIDNHTVAVLKKDLNTVSNDLSEVKKISYLQKENVNELEEALKNKETNYVIVPYNMYMDFILKNDLHILYHLSDISKKYVLTIENKTFLDIMKKYYLGYQKNKQQTSYKTNFLSEFFYDKEITEADRMSYNSSSYNVGYITYMPFTGKEEKDLVGTLSNYLSGFEDLFDVDLKVKYYNNIEELKKDLSSGELDLAFANFNKNGLNIDTILTTNLFEEKYVVLSTEPFAINSIKGLKDKEVITVKNTYINDYLNTNSIKNTGYNNTDDLLRNIKNKSIVVIDKATYDYYKTRKFSDFKVIYEGVLPYNYSFMIRDVNKNKIFSEMFTYYTSSVNYDTIKYKDNTNSKIYEFSLLTTFLLAILVILIIIFLIFFIKKKKENSTIVTNNDKLKYIDTMTSLKNRAYLNLKIKEWDDNVIYPQAFVIIDLNNIKDINDSHGHEEGDTIIKKAASTLIVNQEPNTDIIRTDGNEFLVYMVGYSEKDVISYTRKIYKELKELPYGYGAAIGYSMIMDDIKTVDDAINEATIDMRNKKENNNG